MMRTRLSRENVLDAVKAAAAVSLALFSLYSAIFGVFQDMVQKGTHLSIVLLIVFLASCRRNAGESGFLRSVVDFCLMAGAFAVVFYHVVYYEAVANRWGELTELEYWLAIGCIAALLEATRRAIGWAIVILALVFLLYALAGPYLPGMLAHRGYSVERVLSQLYLGGGGIFGTPLGVSATFVIVIIIYGAFLEKSAAGRVLMDIATGATRSQPRGAGEGVRGGIEPDGDDLGHRGRQRPDHRDHQHPAHEAQRLPAARRRRGGGGRVHRRPAHAAGDGRRR